MIGHGINIQDEHMTILCEIPWSLLLEFTHIFGLFSTRPTLKSRYHAAAPMFGWSDMMFTLLAFCFRGGLFFRCEWQGLDSFERRSSLVIGNWITSVQTIDSIMKDPRLGHDHTLAVSRKGEWMGCWDDWESEIPHSRPGPGPVFQIFSQKIPAKSCVSPVVFYRSQRMVG